MTTETSNARGEWVLVPREPTEAMLDAMHSRIRILCDPAARTASIQNDREVWAAMLAGSPPAPVSVPLDRLTALDGLVDRIAEAIRDGAGLAEGDPPWERLGEERRAPWRADAKRALSVIKESLTAERGAGVGGPDVQYPDAPPSEPVGAEAKTVPVPTRVHLIGETAVIVGTPGRGWDEDAQDAHNCDAMGCATIGPHVLARVPFTDERALPQPAEAQAQGGGEVVQRLRGVLEHGKMGDKCLIAPDLVTAAIAALSAQQPPAEAQPVAWMTHHDEPMLFPTRTEAEAYCDPSERPIPLFTTPPRPEASAPVGVEELVERMRQAPSRLWRADLVGQQISVERMRDILTFALAQQPTAVDEACAVAAIQFALNDPEGMTFLRLWNEGEFETLRSEWPEAPSSIYIGADPLATQHQEPTT